MAILDDIAKVILHSAFHIDVEKHRGHIKNTGVNIEETI
jgi:hypothetical protein